ncbi:precorrin-2 dehydrogenase/sirohydrochlorin ferrochelatase family protein [Aneurinibacillus tyrosinisolvens]|uniref:precorrin-2 dehydrogenase/sirohydrochlorin ferrochelatase family protein n=1 Tax=Aneurinibacillus tyrosinisolvens TaxID=1443435 RepID=UPI00063FB5BC|nr:NAD(P)-dependent oxidoreductase [Aneurinibacillus tyrosinisolvens]
MSDFLLPVMLNIRNKKCIVVGGGKVAAGKVSSLLEAGALVTVISPAVIEELQELAHRSIIVWEEKRFEPADLAGAFLIFAATNDGEVNLSVRRAAAPNQLVALADNPADSAFTMPSYFRRGKLTIAVSTNGASPGLARKIKQDLGSRYDEWYEAYIDFLAQARESVLRTVPCQESRRIIFKRLLGDEFMEYARRKDSEGLQRLQEDLLEQVKTDRGGGSEG